MEEGKSMKKIGTVLLGILMIIGAIAIREVTAFIGMMGYSFYKIMSDKMPKEDAMDFFESMATNSELILYISALGTLVWILIFGIVYKKGKKAAGKSLFEGKIRTYRIVILACMGLGFQFLINSILTIALLVAPKAMESYQQVVEMLGMGNSWISFLLIVVLAPIGEELVFRGVVMNYLKKNLSFMVANIIQALFFGIYHMNLVQGLYAFFLGLVLGWIVQKYGSIRESIILHMAVNLSGCLVGYILPEVLFTSWMGVLLLFALASVLLIFSVRIVKMEEVKTEYRNLVE